MPRKPKVEQSLVTGYANAGDITFGDQRIAKVDPIMSWYRIETAGSVTSTTIPLDLAQAVIHTAQVGDIWQIIFPTGIAVETIESKSQQIKLLRNTIGSITPIAKQSIDPYTVYMNSASTSLVQAWKQHAGVAVGSTLTDEMMLIMARSAVDFIAKSDKDEKSPFLIDPVSNLQLPPTMEGRPLFVERGRDPDTGRKLNIRQFLAAHWGDYTSNHLLFSGDLRALDENAYQAVRYLIRELAALRQQTYDEAAPSVFLELGMLTTEHLTTCPPGLERQVALHRQMHAMKRAKAFHSAAQSADKNAHSTTRE